MHPAPNTSGQALPTGTRLEEFVIERVLGSGGFGITYLARDTSLDRLVGGAVGRNPIGLLIPCHRVIAGDGTLGGYGGGWFGEREELLALKERLLELEGVAPPPRSATRGSPSPRPAPRRGWRA